ncbi:MAG TPA: hypothetical protein VKV40_20190 [Ktedonobacteraceae bacterium]|nr:hypothetical protein [Ktedonobacteraceae bacterium]
MQSENNEQESLAQPFEPELSDAWRELLGLSTEARKPAGGVNTAEQQGGVTRTEVGAEIPVLSNDPWAELQHEQGIEIVDLQQIHPQALNDLDLEQALQFMQEPPTSGSQVQ